MPPFTYNTLLANIGSMRNWGTEIAIGITPLKTKDMELKISEDRQKEVRRQLCTMAAGKAVIE